MPHRYAIYRCQVCWRTHHHVADRGRVRRLWCPVCACNRPFVHLKRAPQKITAEVWPPPARSAHA